MSIESVYSKFLKNNPNPRFLKCYKESDLNFSSNDYLGLSQHPLLISRSQLFTDQWGTGASSSRLVTGNLPIYENLEDRLAQKLNKPAAIIMGAGYQTNISVLEALLDSKVLGAEPLVFCDRLCHVSMLSGCRFFGTLHRFKHNDLEHLEVLLQKYSRVDRPKFILVESLYSMDGDFADLEKLVKLARLYGAFLYVDDAHAVGMYGEEGWGRAPDFANGVDVIMGTFSKGLGSYGAYVGCSQILREYLVNKCKGLIYSTALPPSVLGAMDAAIELVSQCDGQRERVSQLAAELRLFFHRHGCDTGSSQSHIVPWIIGGGDLALEVSMMLEAENIIAATIRPPSVSQGKSRIRFCVNANHTQGDLERLMDKLIKVVSCLKIRCLN